MNYIEFFKSKTNCPCCNKKLQPIVNFPLFEKQPTVRLKGFIKYEYDFYTDKLYLLQIRKGEYKKDYYYLDSLIETVPKVIDMDFTDEFPIYYPLFKLCVLNLECLTGDKTSTVRKGPGAFKNYSLDSNLIQNDEKMDFHFKFERLYYDYRNLTVSNDIEENKTLLYLDKEKEPITIDLVPIESWPKNNELDKIKARLNTVMLLK